MGFEQWSELDGGAGYTGSTRTVGELPPGLYDLVIADGITYWIPVECRTDNIVRFPETPIDAVVGEIETFWDRESSFKKHGLPHKRGILLYGPPGSGKTSTLHLVTRDVIARGGVCVMFGGTDLFLHAYRMFRAVQPATPLVVLMEDLDEILDKSNQSKILNLLDGVEATSKVVFLATTNYPEELGPRIINRPSRFDQRHKVGHPNAESRTIYLKSLLRPEDDIDLERYVRDSSGMSLAHVKELFVATALLGAGYATTLKMLRSMQDSRASSLDDDDGIGAAFRRGAYA